jgi:hypothetical protein
MIKIILFSYLYYKSLHKNFVKYHSMCFFLILILLFEFQNFSDEISEKKYLK